MDRNTVLAALNARIPEALKIAGDEKFVPPTDAEEGAASPFFMSLVLGLVDALFSSLSTVISQGPVALSRVLVYVMRIEELARESLAFDTAELTLVNQKGTRFLNGEEVFVSERADRLFDRLTTAYALFATDAIEAMARLGRELTEEEISSLPSYRAVDHASHSLYRHVARLERRLLELERREAVRVEESESTVSRIEDQDPRVEIMNVVEPERDVLLVFPEGADVAAFRLPRDEAEYPLVLGKSDLDGKTWTRVSLLLQSAGSPDVVRAVALFGPPPAGAEPVGMISAKLCLEHGVHVRGACGFEEKAVVLSADGRVVLFEQEPDPARVSNAVKLELVKSSLASAPEADDIATLMREAAHPLGGTFSGMVS